MRKSRTREIDNATISRRITPQRLINMNNPLVRRILASPLHGAMDQTLLILDVIGRRTGRHGDIPVGYVNLGQQVTYQADSHGYSGHLTWRPAKVGTKRLLAGRGRVTVTL
ncbi:MAG TPA: hypothetical protein VFP34_03790 [Microlunatus sp.]|nr:hypothetical protein [Microlunatus sp.]